jgi:uncharacterized repeat protein (TIGR04138 family)
MPRKEAGPKKSLQEVVEEIGLYPMEAYLFVQEGLGFTVQKIHGADKTEEQEQKTEESRHISGRELSEGLREFALMRWGLLARTVLDRWNIRRTYDFGRIVFALVDNQFMKKTQQDSIEDFRDVYDFATAFDAGYRIECKS